MNMNNYLQIYFLKKVDGPCGGLNMNNYVLIQALFMRALLTCGQLVGQISGKIVGLTIKA